ncbi:MAG: 1-deoxy-D-xylulose-5-phosphate reductoisomerase [Sphaerochaetaceae bacterium]|jgi:1-deoxy-D-xylulose-5-phosphate reductoisomerase|nr:1-deoxy-D-xylulose-5-phosphate reductoisomerase [Sphaerochaetaceae bacterium]MDD5076071.1 1-deoxy-D-xylulose-5-phosphate reductoisomerase [Sphaerochaetaceae bacterium]NLO60271.1 1-deoxy-D-xylulose-5-phosphate reductoisomerase [Spirochaetales bacterium]
MRRKVMILGCTGSIGSSALKGIQADPDRFEIVAISGHRNAQKITKILSAFPIPNVCLSDEIEANGTIDIPSTTTIYKGRRGLLEMIAAVDADIVLNGIIGSAGLEPTIACLHAKKDVALANKESLVMAGNLVLELAKANGVSLYPVDSEHAAIEALIRAHTKTAIESLILTASGGPFRNLEKDKFTSITVEQAIAHPTWNMGPKISVDSATLANKGLEVIEAAVLFGFESSRIEVVIHPQSIVHSMIRMRDGSLYAQLSKPDMVHPIMQALGHDMPVMPDVVTALDFSRLSLEFSLPDFERFPMLSMAKTCASYLGAYPIAFNAANEVAVQLFVEKKISFTSISEIVRQVLTYDWSRPAISLEHILEIDAMARSKSKFLAQGYRIQT